MAITGGIIFVNLTTGQEVVLPVTPKEYSIDRGVNIETIHLTGFGDVHLAGAQTAFSPPWESTQPAAGTAQAMTVFLLKRRLVLYWPASQCQGAHAASSASCSACTSEAQINADGTSFPPHSSCAITCSTRAINSA